LPSDVKPAKEFGLRKKKPKIMSVNQKISNFIIK
jgi:hypothetical protein